MASQTVYVNRKRYAVGLFWQPVSAGFNARNYARSLSRNVDKKLNLLYARTRAFDKGYSWYKNLAIFFARCMPKFILGKDKLIKDIEKLSKKYNYEQSAYVGNLVGAWHEKEMVQKAWLGQPLLVPFETGHIFIPQNADACLTHVYGDYMKLPPIEKQVSHHDYIYENLYESYTQK